MKNKLIFGKKEGELMRKMYLRKCQFRAILTSFKEEYGWETIDNILNDLDEKVKDDNEIVLRWNENDLEENEQNES